MSVVACPHCAALVEFHPGPFRRQDCPGGRYIWSRGLGHFVEAGTDLPHSCEVQAGERQRSPDQIPPSKRAPVSHAVPSSLSARSARSLRGIAVDVTAPVQGE